MSHKVEKQRYREEKRQEKQRRRQEKRELKQRHRDEKKQEKQRHREEKRRLREEFVNRLFNLSLSDTTPNIVVGHASNSDVRYNNFDEIPIENDVATLRTMFPDCDPMYIRSCLVNETKEEERVRKVAEKLLTTSYPKAAPVSPLTPPTAPPLLPRSSFESPFDDEAPPTYEESLGNQTLQPPPLPNRHQRAASWGGNGTSTPSSTKSCSTQCKKSSQFSQCSRGAATTSTEVTEAFNSAVRTASTEVTEQFNAAVKTVLDNFKPATVEHALHKYSYIWSRPVPSHFKYKPLSQQFKILPKDKFSIQKGFNQCNCPSKELRSRDISEPDWCSFMNGLNSIIGVNSIKGNSNNSEGISVGLKWVSWMNIATMDESLMETNIKALNDYLDRWNSQFFNPRKIVVLLIDNRIQSTNPFKKYEQYLLVRSI